MTKSKELKKYRACKGCVLPIFYDGKIIHVSSKSKQEIDLALLDHESKHIFKTAIKDKQIEEVK